MISKETEQKIKSTVDIVDIVSNYIELKKAGGSFKSLCPFHTEKTPSFVVSPSKQIFHCFSCKKGGDTISFVREYEKLNYPEALEKIADMMNISVEYEQNNGEKTNFQEYKRLFESINTFYQKSLDDGHRKYLYDRGVSEQTIREWGIGFAPRNPKTQKFLEENFLSIPLSMEIGIMAEGKGRTYARFSERIMFPIKSHTGHIVGYAGRTLKDDKKIAKYINSAFSKLFDKSSILFGFDKAKEHIYKKKFFILHEGQFDIVLSHQENVKTTIATMGTALTEKHLPILKKTGAKALIAFDGDRAGRESALKTAILLTTHEFDGGVALFPKGEDPASLIADKRVEEYKKILKDSTPMIEFILREITGGFDLTNPHNKNEALKECTKYLSRLNPVISSEYTNFVSEILQIDRQHISIESGQKRIQPVVRIHSTVEKSLLLSLYQKPDYREWCDYTSDKEAWQNKELYFAILENRATIEMMSEIMATNGVFQLNTEQFISSVKNKQKKYLQQKLKSCSDFDEMIVINEQIKKVG